jgi:hypothetical protein
MRPLKDNKGQIRVIEAFFASILLLSVLALLPSGTKITNSGDQSLISMGQHVLFALDYNGYLSKLIENRSWSVLRNCVQSSLPPTVWFNLTILDENNNPINDTLRMSSGTPINQKILSLDYICASQSPNYNIYIVRLQLSVVS